MKRFVEFCRIGRWAIISMIFAVALTGCSSALGPDQLREKALQSRSNEVVIGVVWPFGDHNDLFREGLHLALEQVNQKGILGGKMIRLIEEDDGGSVTKGMAIAQKFAENNTITGVIGHRSSAVTIPASRIYDRAGVVLLSPASTSPKLTDTRSPYIFRNIPNDNQLGQALALYAAGTDNRNIAIYYTNEEYGRGLANAFEDQAGKSGLKVIDRLSGYKDTADVRRIAEKWELLDCDLILVAAPATEGVAFIRELRAVGMDTPIIGGDALDSEELTAAGEMVQGTVIASVYNPHDSGEINQQFREQFTAQYGTEPGKWAAQAYDSLLLLAHAIEEAGSRSSRETASRLAAMSGWEGATGQRSFAGNGDVLEMDIIIKKLRNGEFDYSAN
ncbi:branched-chain amino acid ABC transporter substrate-binding protein [Paenibacillaceae bacterium]|nr:branched-chain amino acid ABC transporter substrate-binding protein [Paenibacillaceae bacterium]